MTRHARRRRPWTAPTGRRPRGSWSRCWSSAVSYSSAETGIAPVAADFASRVLGVSLTLADDIPDRSRPLAPPRRAAEFRPAGHGVSGPRLWLLGGRVESPARSLL